MSAATMDMRDGHTYHNYCVSSLVNGREDGRDKSGESATIFLDSSETLPIDPATRTWQPRHRVAPRASILDVICAIYAQSLFQ